MTDGITTTSTNGSTAQTTTAKGKTSLGKDDFLNLMITQMKYQDPMNPMDSTQYSAQLAQFSSLEQLTNLNDYVKQSIDANYLLSQSINNTMTATLIGKEAKLSGSSITYNGQDQAQLGYKLPSNASSVDVKIYNSSGALVKTISGLSTDVGEHKLSWNFTDNDGNKVAPGDYSFKIEAKSSAKEEMTADVYKIGTIQSLKFSSSGSSLVIDGVEYQLSDILEISNKG